MIIYKIAIALFIFSGIVGIYNDLGITGNKVYDPGLNNISETEIREVFKPGSDGAVTDGGIVGDALALPGFLMKMIGLIWKLLQNAFNLGGVFSQYVPGIVGEQVGLLITAITYIVYAWGLIQIYMKFSSKNVD